MQDLTSFYQNQINKHQEVLAKVKHQLYASSMVRLAIFCSAAIALYFLSGSTKWVLAIILLTFVAFLFLVSRHTDLQQKRDKLKALVKINETEIKVLNRDFHHLSDGNEFKDPLHYFSQDIDLFGRGSFYQYANRTALRQGSETLAGIFMENSIDAILKKQEAIKELAELPEWRQDFSATATLVKTETPYVVLIKWLNSYEEFVPSVMKWLPSVFSILSVVLWALYFLDLVSGWILFGWFLLGLGITAGFLKRIYLLSVHTGKVQSTFQQYQKLINKLEDTVFRSESLNEIRSKVADGKPKTSVILKRFSVILSALDQRNNMLFGVVGNGFLLWDLMQCHKIENWIESHGKNVRGWFETIAFFDAYNSLGNFAFNHPDYAFPKLSQERLVLKSKGAGHPLLDSEKCVLNDFQIDNEQFFIITGANMAGKSTFLRTVSLQLMMANVGLPVCAKEVEYNPIKLITSMRTTDSLTDDESYFFSELKRLKFIVEEIQTDKYFIVLDEILKGTNSTDKAKGSRKFVERLVGSKSTGIIATHDLSLCEVAKELPQIENHYFDAEIIDNELHFDYKFKEGICQNMNASFLLKKMEIVK